jgi:hypothetical protein
MEPANPYPALADALRERLAVIADHAARRQDPAAHLERLKTVSEKILRLQSQLPPPVDPRLQHFLQGCSYDKALAFLDENY